MAPKVAVAYPVGPPDSGRVRELVTPEGIDLRIVLAEASQRAAAFLLDAVIIIGTLIVVTIICAVTGLSIGKEAGAEVVGVVWILVFFLLRNLYFVIFEMGPRAATPGKRAVGLRVATRNGGRLTVDAVFARNALREIEVYLPLTFLIADAKGIDTWIILTGIIWCGIFALFPLFNRDRLRAGDLVAGTWVVQAPKRKLLVDLVDSRRVEGGRYAFTVTQLDAYGIKELQVLENVLRQNNRTTTTSVADSIRKKIAWERGPSESDGEFLDAFYAGLRGRLEGQLLFGRRRKDKFDKG